MANLAAGLQAHIIRNHTIPSATNWTTTIANVLGADSVSVSTNSRGFARIYLIDPNLRIGTGVGAALPYAQTSAGSTNPASPRILIISSLGIALPTGLNSGVASSATAFNNIWDATDGTVPAGWSWTGRGDDLRIQRINLAPLFVQLILNNDSPTTGHYAVDASSHLALPSNPFTTYLLLGTRLGLHSTDGTLQSTEVLQDPRSFVYEKGIWRGKLFSSQSARRLSGADLQAAFDLFMAAPPNANAKSGATQARVTTAMLSYMSNYINWAVSGFPSNMKNAVAQSQVDIWSETKNYMFKPEL
jgi:hypothetical protein